MRSTAKISGDAYNFTVYSDKKRCRRAVSFTGGNTVITVELPDDGHHEVVFGAMSSKGGSRVGDIFGKI